MSNWKGGILFLDVTDNDVNKWDYRIYFQDAQNAVVTKVEFMRCFNRWYMYFGSGRWFYKTDNPLSGQRERIYGVPVRCDGSGCEVVTDVADVTDSSDNVCTDAQNGVIRGWYIKLDPNEEGYMKERSITDPTSTEQDVIIFPTSQPTADLCGFGGRSRVWILNCATGGAVDDDCPGYRIDKLTGKLLLQLSGGDIREISLSEFIKNKVGRFSKYFDGMLPDTSQPYVEPPTPKKNRTGEIVIWYEH